MLAGFQSILKRWNRPSSAGPSGVSTRPPSVLVRAYSCPPASVLNIAQGSDGEANVVPNPACWKCSPENFALNSSVRGLVKTADGVVLAVSPETQAPVASVT